MSQSHEPSYYEIALTNRQVLVVFVVLLICVVAAFFSGVWIGQQGDEVAIAEVVETTAGDSEVGTDNGAEVLHFFSEEGSDPQPSLADFAEQPTSDTTLAEDVGVADAEEPDPQQEAESAQPSISASSEPAPETETETPVRTADSQQPSSQPAMTSEPTVAEGEHVIQVFSSADEGQAKKLISKLSGGGFPAFLSPVDVGGQTMYRVRIGPYAELADAETVAARVRRSYKLDTWVTR